MEREYENNVNIMLSMTKISEFLNDFGSFLKKIGTFMIIYDIILNKYRFIEDNSYKFI